MASNAKITFAPGGNSVSFGRRKMPGDLPEYLARFGLNGYEIECGRGIYVTENMYGSLPEIADKNGIYLSLHAPYFISLSSESAETRAKSVEWILDSAQAAHRLRLTKIVIHSGSCAKITREAALDYARETLTLAQKALDEAGLTEINLCPETMGKINQLGTLTEVLALCQIDERFLPCIDFGHLNARTHGGIKTRADYAAILDETEAAIGFERASNLHIHFSKIMYTDGGEKKHLTFGDTQYGPDYEPLLDELFSRAYTPSIVCESDGTQAEDAAAMKNYYSQINNIKN